MKFDFTPDPKVLLALTHTPIQPMDALCELIDNAIDSFHYAKIQGVVEPNPLVIVQLPTRKQAAENRGLLRIQDNGPGMTAQQAEKSIKAGFSGNNPYDTLGLFGMGFNISTGKLGNITTLMTARKDSATYVKTVINLEKLNQHKDYELEAMELPHSYLYACGPAGMLRAAAEKSPAGAQLSFDVRMGCGFGACMGCTMQTVNGPRRVCRDGPIFRKEEILWDA